MALFHGDRLLYCIPLSKWRFLPNHRSVRITCTDRSPKVPRQRYVSASLDSRVVIVSRSRIYGLFRQHSSRSLNKRRRCLCEKTECRKQKNLPGARPHLGFELREGGLEIPSHSGRFRRCTSREISLDPPQFTFQL